jgi:hypothetical protein
VAGRPGECPPLAVQPMPCPHQYAQSGRVDEDRLVHVHYLVLLVSVEEAQQEFPQKVAGEHVDLAVDLDDHDAAVLVMGQP